MSTPSPSASPQIAAPRSSTSSRTSTRQAAASPARPRPGATGDAEARPVDPQGGRKRKHSERPATGVDVHKVDGGRFALDDDVISLWLRGWTLFHAEDLRGSFARRSDDSHG